MNHMEEIFMIYTVTLNPAVDYVVRLPRLQMGVANRTLSEEFFFGGKGINVSLVLRELGVATTALGLIADFTGAALRADLERRGIVNDFVELDAGFTRINVKIKTEAEETEINGRGPDIPQTALAALLVRLDRLQTGDTLVLAGSVPGSVPSDIYEVILSRLAGREIRFVVDAEKKLLLPALAYRPFLVKPNLRELSDIAGREFSGDEEIVAAARELQRAGAMNVLVSLGGDGALLLDETGRTHRAPAVGGRPVNTVGAGDSMVAGFLAGVKGGYDHALRLGLAAGGATASAVGLGDAATIEKLLAETKKHRE